VKTVDKTMSLLEFFSVERPEIGLSDLARLSGFDKAATRRFLLALMRHGFVEQNPSNSKYHLGAGFGRFARLREATHPLEKIVQGLLDEVSEALGETAHASVRAGSTLVSIGASEPQRANRVHVDMTEALPFHATASGTVVLAFSEPAFVDDYWKKGDFEKYASGTVTDKAGLIKRMAAACRQGYAVANGSFEDDVIGTAAPFFDPDGSVRGAIAVAAPASRMTTEHGRAIIGQVIRAANAVTAALGGAQNEILVKAERNLAA